MQKKVDSILQSKQHFEILDGLRGVAALAVVVFHFMEIAVTDYSQNFIGHGFLAVDFFFCLSGFVIGYAYNDRLGKMDLPAFFTARLIRLHPMVIAGTVLGLLSFLFDPFAVHPGQYSTIKLILLVAGSMLVIPLPLMPDRFFNLFGFNPPAWSLFWEYMANIIYAVLLYKASRRVLIILTLLAAVMLCYVAHKAGSLMGGWAGENFWDGCARISYSFLAGLLIYRCNWIIKTKLGFASLAILLVVPFIMPWSAAWNWLTEPLVVLIYFPLLLALGAGARLEPRFKKICILSGKISYPLYMTHYAALTIFGNYCSTHTAGAKQLFFIIATGTLLLVGIAWLIMKLYDIPVRTYLTERRKLFFGGK